MAAHVKIYTRQWCGYCTSAERLLRAKGVAFEQVDATGDHATREWLVEATGRTTVPQIFIDGKPIVNKWKITSQVPAISAASDTISKDMKKRGFKFVGSTIVYAHMQATGMVNDHLTTCFRYKALAGKK